MPTHHRDPDADRAQAILERGWDRLDEGKFDEALSCADAFLGAVPEDVAGFSLRAAALDGLGRSEEAAAAHEEALRRAPDELDVIADAADFYLSLAQDAGVPGWERRGLELARAGAEAAHCADDGPAFADFVGLETRALSGAGHGAEALARVDAAIAGGPRSGRLLTERGMVLFELCRFEEAARQLQVALDEDARDACANHTLGLIAERMQRTDEAQHRFRLAAEEAPDIFPVPVKLSSAAFDAAVEDALRELPEEVRARLCNVAVVVEDVPSTDDLLATVPPLSPTILGMYRGSSYGQQGSSDPWSQFPASIVLYQRNLEHFASNRDDLLEQIRVTVLHEVGHFVGLDDDQLRDRDLD